MKHLKLTIAIAATGMLLGAGQAAYAAGTVPTSYTYFFNSDGGLTYFDGSTITIDPSDDDITSWNLMNNDGAQGLVDLTPDNSFIQAEDVTDADGGSWTGYFYISDSYQTPSLPGLSDTFYGYSDGTGASNGGDVDDFFDGTDGSWTAETPSVPDALNSFQLLAIALGSLGASSLFFRKPTAVRVRD